MGRARVYSVYTVLKQGLPYLVDAQHRRTVAVTESVEGPSEGLHVAGSLYGLISLELAAEQRGHRVNHHQSHQATGEKDGHSLRDAGLQRPLEEST